MATITANTVSVVCDGCGKPIEPGDGYLEVDSGAAFELHRKRRAATHPPANGRSLVPVDVGALMAAGPDIPWQGWHRACDPHPDSGTYWFAVERIATIADVLEWTAHLSEKQWLASTDWTRLLRGIANGSDGRLICTDVEECNR